METTVSSFDWSLALLFLGACENIRKSASTNRTISQGLSRLKCGPPEMTRRIGTANVPLKLSVPDSTSRGVGGVTERL